MEQALAEAGSVSGQNLINQMSIEAQQKMIQEALVRESTKLVEESHKIEQLEKLSKQAIVKKVPEVQRKSAPIHKPVLAKKHEKMVVLPMIP